MLSNHAPLSVQAALERREGEPERRLVGRTHSEDGRSRRSCVKDRRNLSRRAPAELFLDIGRGQPVHIYADTAPYRPISLASGIPGEACTRTPQVVDGVKKRIWSGLCITVGNLLVPCGPCSEVEVSEDG